MALSEKQIILLAVCVTLVCAAVALGVYFAIRKSNQKDSKLSKSKLSDLSKSYIKSEIMKNYNVIFAGTCRNVDKHIERVLNSVEECGRKFNDYAVVIYENDSSDKTRTILNRMKKDNYHYIFEDNIKEPRRTKRLERGRNMCLEKVRELNSDTYYQYLIVLDMDEINGKGTFVKTIDSCFVDMNWDVLAGNQSGRYYDLWALRNSDLNYDCRHEWRQKGHCMYRNITYPTGQWKEVDSAFGGIAIYKLSSIPEHCKYVGEHKDSMEKCEHVEFHECIKANGGKLYINGDFLNDGDDRGIV
jgi:hypothetical protein